ncbi:sensor histidine kinase [Pedococcus sp. 5OH_020]|uniref:sensor histidine kinase n=1 Tax=Pedococcus sp. 5OH_020 TaxID=2989814 RepID=UPI0022E9AAE1|nr:histidine kinase [Pedococcus sp. 5OH_020]
MPGLLPRLTWRDWAVPGSLWAAGQIELWVVGPQTAPVHGPQWPFAVALTAAALALCLRRSRPVGSLLVVVAAFMATATPNLHAFLLSALYLLVVGVFACGRYGRTPAKYAAVLLPELPLLLWVYVIPEIDLANAWAWGLNAVWIFALGAAFRHEGLLRERVAQAVAARSRVQVAEERLGLAREVHDVVSHSLSVVVVQSELARVFMTSDPARAQEAITRVQETGREALGETRRLLEALRDPSQANRAAQAPTWLDVPELVRRMRESGLQVSLDAHCGDPALTAEASATAYRVVQEALTNALRHAGTSPTSVAVSKQADLLVIDVQNDRESTPGHDAADSAPGYGLSGMHERVAACGGMLTTGRRPGGGYRVRAVLPLGHPS